MVDSDLVVRGRDGNSFVRRALITNQLLALAVLWLKVSATVRHSKDLCETRKIDVPAMSNVFFQSLGQGGILGLAVLAAVIIIGTAWFQNARVADWVSSIVFVVGFLFLLVAVLWAYLPLEAAIKRTS
jgi:hypothetical protein